VKRLEALKTRIIIPTPALSEVLVHAGAAGPDILETLTRTVFKVEPFDTKAAVEAALMIKAAIDAGDKRSGVAAAWAKVKFDRQIVAIAKVFNASMIYSDDKDVKTLAAVENIPVTRLEELSLPAPKPQMEMELATPAEPIDPQSDLFSGQDEEPPDIDEPDEELT